MRIWRDIIGRRRWERVMARFNEGKEDSPNAYTTSKNAPVGKVAQLRSVFDRSLSSRAAALDKLTRKIDLYHGIA